VILTPHGRPVRQPVALTKDQAQCLLDGEVFFVNQGMVIHLRCSWCALAGEAADCGCSLSDDGRTVMVECRCRTRTYDQGDLTAPPSPRTLVTRQDLPEGEKYHDPLARGTMAQIAAYEALLHQLDLEGGLVCLRCQQTVRRDRGDAAIFRLECPCTIRTFPLAHVAASTH
jgi:hypothetical protein